MYTSDTTVTLSEIITLFLLLLVAVSYTSFLLHFSFVSPSFLLHFSFISPSFLLHFSFISPSFLLHFSFVSPSFLLHFYSSYRRPCCATAASKSHISNSYPFSSSPFVPLMPLPHTVSRNNSVIHCISTIS